MLRLLLLIPELSIIFLAMYNAVTAAWGWKDRKRAEQTGASLKLRVVIPAHNEAHVLPHILTDLADSSEPKISVWVVADRCTDETSAVTEGAGVYLAERTHGKEGKGAALAWFLEGYPVRSDEALVIFDADSRVPAGALKRIADELNHGHDVVQCYLDVANPKASLIAEASALSYWAGNRMVQLARSNMGWSADLGGTGMAFTPQGLRQAGGFTDSLTEDQELGARLVLAGGRVEWVHDVRILDEKPESVGVAARQRARWMTGKRTTARKYFWQLIKTGRPIAWDQALRLVQPGRSFVALASGILAVAAVISGTTLLLPWPVWTGVTALQVLLPIPFLAKEGVTGRRLARYPLIALLAALWLPIRIVSGRMQGWYHTPHGEISDRV